MFSFFSGCFGTIFHHIGLLEPQLPTSQQLRYDPTSPPRAGGYIQTSLASFPMSPLLQTGVFVSTVPQQGPMTEQQQFYQ